VTSPSSTSGLLLLLHLHFRSPPPPPPLGVLSSKCTVSLNIYFIHMLRLW
jgi:hypothetical protein